MIEECIFCGGQTVITREHIPPNNLFPKPKPSNLITVPACLSCNRGFQIDEEYFRIVISAMCGDSPKFRKLLLGNVNKQLDHQPKLASQIQNDLKKVVVAGEVRYGLPNTNHRFSKVIHKIIKGLYFYESKRVLPIDHKISWNFIDDEYIDEMGGMTCRAMRSMPIRDIGNGIFTYAPRFLKMGNSFWILRFYEYSEFFAVTMKDESGRGA